MKWTMPARHFESIVLDYAEAAETPKLLDNLSTVACSGQFLWTASDEGRTIECLKIDGDRYRFHRQICLDDVFKNIPGQEDGDEADIESIDIAGGQLWVCGSHCRVRQKPDKENPDVPKHKFRSRPSRCLFGRIDLKGNGGALANSGQTLPFDEKGSLRWHFAKNQFLRHFVNLPSKENGLDIEGMAVDDDKVFFGLRGPLIDSIAVVMQAPIKDGLRIADEPKIHFLDLGGLGVRDLARDGSYLLVLAGPVASTAGPFRIYRWSPRETDAVQDLDEPILDDVDGLSFTAS